MTTLEQALEPFARIGEQLPAMSGNAALEVICGDGIRRAVTDKDFRHAAQALASHRSGEGERDAIARIIHEHFGFNVLTDDLIRVQRCASEISLAIRPQPQESEDQGDGITRSLSRTREPQ